MDGLMFDTEKLSIPAWKKAGEKHGYSIEPAHIVETIGIYFKDAQRIFEKYFGKDFPFDEVRELKEKYAFEYIEENGIPVKEGLYGTIDYLEDKKNFKVFTTSFSEEQSLSEVIEWKSHWIIKSLLILY